MKIVSVLRRADGSVSTEHVSADARALFERVIGTFPSDRARPLWERWARYEYQYGDLAAAHKLEKRMSEVYSTGSFPSFPVMTVS